MLCNEMPKLPAKSHLVGQCNHGFVEALPFIDASKECGLVEKRVSIKQTLTSFTNSVYHADSI